MANFARRFGERLRNARRRRGWTQAQLAEAAEVGANYVPRLERGEMTPSVESAHRLASALGVALDALCAGDVARPLDGSGVVGLRMIEGLSETDLAVLRQVIGAVEQVRGAARELRRKRH
jgi:transcriptional regulator with XRE-family HTH domain